MTATTLTHLPLAAGSAVVTSTGRFGLWAIARYMRAPLANTGMIALATMTAMAGSNALYNQTAEHPAPLFAPAPNVPQPVDRPADISAVPEVAPVLPAIASPQVAVPPARIVPDTTGSVAAPVVPSEPVGNADVFAVQKKLLDLGLFEGTVDGYYGPMTARAIRAFEERNGLTPEGAMTEGVIEAILNADAAGAMATPAPVANVAVAPVAVAPTSVATAPVPPTPVAVRPDPVVVATAAASVETIDTVIASATDTIDSLLGSIDATRSTPPVPSANAPVPAVSVQASAASQPMPPVVAPVAPVVQPVAEVPVVQEASIAPEALRSPAATNQSLVSQIQRGLASLGFLHGAVSGEADEATARAIRNFEVYHNYPVTGAVRPELLDMLVAANASI